MPPHDISAHFAVFRLDLATLQFATNFFGSLLLHKLFQYNRAPPRRSQGKRVRSAASGEQQEQSRLHDNMCGQRF
jgi:hypothetical protein